MIKLGTRVIPDTYKLSPNEIVRTLDKYAHFEFSDGLAGTGWQGWLVAKNTNNRPLTHYTFYYYTVEPLTLDYTVIYKIDGSKLTRVHPTPQEVRLTV